MQTTAEFIETVKNYTSGFYPVVPFNAATDKLLLLNFTNSNKELADDMLTDTARFSNYINTVLERAGATYGIGGYNEHRTIYSRSRLFGSPHPNLPPEGEGTATAQPTPDAETGKCNQFLEDDTIQKDVSISQHSAAAISPLRGDEGGLRRLHLGVDIWAPAGTPVHAPLEGTVHSLGFNDAYGDYGATLILQHNLNDFTFYTLYGHLSLRSIQDKKEGEGIEKGQWIAAFGEPQENGHWPPHLHFQVMLDMQGYKGDYPGVCAFSEREKYLANCPDPDLFLGMMQYAVTDIK